MGYVYAAAVARDVPARVGIDRAQSIGHIKENQR